MKPTLLVLGQGYKKRENPNKLQGSNQEQMHPGKPEKVNIVDGWRIEAKILRDVRLKLECYAYHHSRSFINFPKFHTSVLLEQPQSSFVL